MRLVLDLFAGHLALNNVSFLIADNDLSCEDVLFEYPVLLHLGIDSPTFLERNRSMLDGRDCSSDEHCTTTKTSGSLTWLVVARMPRVIGSKLINEEELPLDQNRSRAKYFGNQIDDEPFPDPN